MSETNNGSWSAAPFISLDGGDDNGVRAEVRVSKGFGTVASIEPSSNGRSAQIKMTIQHPKIKRPIGGWMNMDEDAFKILQEAKESGQLVYFRIESQRKKGVDRTTPIDELTVDMETAGKNTTRIFVGAGFTEPITLTSEALTDPDDDPKMGSGVKSAIAARNSKPSAPTGHGNGNAQARSHSSGRPFVREEASYKTYNSDGSFNLGSAAFAAAVSAEQFARNLLSSSLLKDDENSEEKIFIMAKAILQTADWVQAAEYGEGYKNDRSSASHTRARGIIYDTIREHAPYNSEKFPVGSEDFTAWIRGVREIAHMRMHLAFRLATEDDATITETGEALNNENNVTEKAPSYPEFIRVINSASVDADAPRTSEETLENLKALVSDAGVTNMGALGTLLEATTGMRVVADNADSVIEDFIDTYVASGDLKQAVQWIEQRQAQ